MAELRKGFTTGSCAAAAAKAACEMCFSNKKIEKIGLMTPAGIVYEPSIYAAKIGRKYAECYVIKESGDDPDITAGIHIHARVELTKNKNIVIHGGVGIGKVTRPGLDQPVGEYAINSVPRKMISEQIEAVFDNFDYEGGAIVTIYAPEGEKIAEKTFNAHMGIMGGISIIGTTGIVEPMSTKALVDTIKLDIAMQYQESSDVCIMAPGNYGVTFLREKYDIDPKRIVLFSNYFGDSVKLAEEAGFKKILLCSHIGKLIKVAGGAMNTHSMYGDRRIESMNEMYKEACLALQIEKSDELSKQILGCVSTTAVLDILSAQMIKTISEIIVSKAMQQLKTYIDSDVAIKIIMYDNKYGELAKK